MNMEATSRPICRNSEEDSSKEGVMPEDLCHLFFEGWKDYEEGRGKEEKMDMPIAEKNGEAAFTERQKQEEKGGSSGHIKLGPWPKAAKGNMT